MPHTKEKTESKIPTFKTIEEEAEFWDTHSFGEFEDELEEVADLVIESVRSSKGVTVNPHLRIPLGERIRLWLAHLLRGKEIPGH